MYRVKFLSLSLLLMATLAVSSTFAATSGAKFKSASGSVSSTGALVVSFDESGLGNENVNYVLRSDATATYACINGGGKNPSAANKRTMSGAVLGSATLEPKNGRVIGTISAGPLSAGDFSCPSGQRLVLASVSYSNITLTDTTNGASIRIPNQSRTLITLR